MKRSWRDSLLPLLAVLGAFALVFVAGWRQADRLAEWAGRPSLGWNALALAGYALAAFVAARTYAVLRNPRLYALAFLLLPLGAIHALQLSNPPAPASARVVVATDGAAPVTGEGAEEAGRAPRVRFTPLPDSLAKRYPALPERLLDLTRALYAGSFLLLPVAVLLATATGMASLTRRRLRVVTAGLVGLLALAAVGLALFGPADLAAYPRPELLLGAPAVVAAAVALLRWQTPAGLGGGVAGLLLCAAAAGLAGAGLDPGQLGLPLKRVPWPTERLLVTALPGLLVLVVAWEWAVSMSHITKRDALTQIFNKAYAEAIVSGTNELELGSTFAVAILDIDHFKAVNDTHGHGAGDVVLQEVAATIHATIRNRGLVCRTGGEEITVFFPGLGQEAAKDVCEEVRRAVEDLTVKTASSDGRTRKLNVTLSVGVAANRATDGDTQHPSVKDVVEAADRAVYAAKRSGRNRVITD